MLRTAVLLALSALPASAAPNVIADIPPVEALVARVMDGIGAPAAALVPPGADPHALALRPSQARAMNDADVVFWIGPEMTPWLDGALGSLTDDATVVALLDVEDTVLLDTRESGGDAHDHAHDEHGHEGVDPHAWLSPENGALWLGVIAEALAEVDPENARTYRNNALAGSVEIGIAAAEIEAEIKALGPVTYALAHDAFRYFEDRFGLEPLTTVRASDAVAPGPARVSAVMEAIRENDVTCLMAEPGQAVGIVETAIGDSGVPVVEVSPLVADGGYVGLLMSVADAFVRCAQP